jgi:hypothetical protein
LRHVERLAAEVRGGGSTSHGRTRK